ncbi:chemotaxis protein CheW [Chamaesiphon sp. VAR_69_metabat_338]|uniref:chemotaxis protein CheW n=1 Tax=Chamaesiphon sp. VAR_69_metabat_338 TaxID=2964704 RepID=UPI00286DA053|nr:chemotaxis protein CheW [Chamaesiphon sp. VAR_69_metabat_338]
MNQIIDRVPPRTNRQPARKAEESELSQRFLGFTIGDSINALIPLVDLQATIKISLSEILPVPKMHASLLGIINYGGKATWVLDLAHLMGGSGYLSAPTVTTGMGMLFQVQQETVALLIDRVGTIETHDLQARLPIDDLMFGEGMRAFLSGYFIDADRQSRVVLDLDRVIKSIL